MKKLPIFFVLLLACGCDWQDLLDRENSPIALPPPSEDCPDKPDAKVVLKRYKEIPLNKQAVTESGQVSKTKAVGYVFEGKANQTLSYQTNDDICFWIINPNNQPMKGTKLPEDGKYTIQVASLKGVRTFKLEMSLERLQNSSSLSPTPSSSSSPSPGWQFTQKQAVAVLQNWFAAKRKVFAPPYDRSLVNQYLTGDLYYETLQKNGGGSLGWLQSHGCYYSYEFTNIEQILSFDAGGSRPSIKVKVHERLARYGPGCNRPMHSSKDTFTYWFEKDNGVWKIYKYWYPGKPG